jgi:two-component system sporulation sensor kinase B
MPDGGTLFLRVQAMESYVQLRIEDTGIGMDDEQLKRLGKPYYSTKDKGTGLGTMVVFRIIEAMGGSVSVQSEKGRGTVFTILLPLDKSDPAISLKSPASRA